MKNFFLNLAISPGNHPLRCFSNRAEDYAKYRPNYPDAAIDTILEGLCSSSSSLITADIGAGTGIASRQLAERGVYVLAIEPDPAMKDIAALHPLVEFHKGTAEVTHLPDASVDLVTCFQSFHWFDPRQSLREFRRILKSSGRLALVWNQWDSSDKFTASYMRLVGRASFPKQLRRLAISSLLSNFLHPSSSVNRWMNWLRFSFLGLPYFASIRRYKLSHRQKLDLAGLIGLAMSQSAVPLSGSAHQQLVFDLQQLYARSSTQDGFINLAYHTTIYLTERE